MKKKQMMTWVGIGLIASGMLFPIHLFGLPLAATQVLSIFVGCLVLWLTVAIDWPSILCIAMLALIQPIGMNTVLKNSFGNSTFAFLLFTFICIYALSTTTVLERIAVSLLNSPIAKKGKWAFFTMLLVAVYGIGTVISPTVLFMIFFPIFEEICSVLQLKKEDKTAEVLLVSITFSIALSTAATPISHVFSMMAMSFYQSATGIEISYLSYMGMAIPVTLLLITVWFLTVRYVIKPDFSVLESIDLQHMSDRFSPMSKREWWIVGIFTSVVLLWLAPDFVKPLFPGVAKALSTYTIAFPAMLGVVALCVIQVEDQPLLSLSQALEKGVHWPSLFMVGATLALGTALTMEEIGFVALLNQQLSPIIAQFSPLWMVGLFVGWAAIQTNLSSNLVTVSVVTTVAIPVVQSSGGDVSLAAVCALIGLMASLAYATPPAMPYVAISTGSGWVKTTTMFTYGVYFMVWGILVATFVGYPLATALM